VSESRNQNLAGPAGAGNSAAPAGHRRWLRKPIYLVITATVLYFVVAALVDRFAAIDWSEDITFRPLFMLAAVLCLLAARIISLLTYRLLLACFCQPPSWPAMSAIAWLPPLGKYIPGKFASVAGALLLLNQHGIPAATGASLLIMLNGLMITVGLTMSVPLTLSQGLYSRLPLAWLWCILLVTTGLVCLHPRLFAPAANYVLRKLRRPPLQALPRTADLVKPVILMAANWAVTGLALLFMAVSVTTVSSNWLPLFISVQALAMTAGFLAFFAPAGVGVREGILLMILEPVISAGPAAVVVLAMRVLQTLVELAAALVGLAVLTAIRKRPA